MCVYSRKRSIILISCLIIILIFNILYILNKKLKKSYNLLNESLFECYNSINGCCYINDDCNDNGNNKLSYVKKYIEQPIDYTKINNGCDYLIDIINIYKNINNNCINNFDCCEIILICNSYVQFNLSYTTYNHTLNIGNGIQLIQKNGKTCDTIDDILTIYNIDKFNNLLENYYILIIFIIVMIFINIYYIYHYESKNKKHNKMIKLDNNTYIP